MSEVADRRLNIKEVPNQVSMDPPLLEGSVKFYVARHGETDFNKMNMLQGHIDTRLNETGKIQALKLAGALHKFGIGAIYTSDLNRAYETATIISKEISVPITGKSADLRETSFGQFEGKTYSEIADLMGVSIDTLMKEGLDKVIHVESSSKIANRSISFLENIARERIGESILVITHGGVMRSIASKILDISLNYLYFSNGDFLELSYGRNGWKASITRDNQLYPVE